MVKSSPRIIEMNIVCIKKVSKSLAEELTEVWEKSARATHDFLKEEDFEELKPLTHKALLNAENLLIIRDNAGFSHGFLGFEGDKIQMFFISPEYRGKGQGKKLLEYALEKYKLKFVDVNEDNRQGVGFYEHMGFQVFDRSPLDDGGKPFPLLHMVKL